GVAVRGPMIGKDHAYVLVRDWLGRQPTCDRDVALAELARRYLVGHAPADDRDLARWAGLPLRDARAGLTAIAAELVERDDGLVHLAKHPPVAEVPGPRLLGAFDPLLLGWTSRELILGPHTHLVTLNGIFRPFAMVKGRAVGTWKLNRGKVTIEPLGKVSKAATAALAADAADVERFMTGA
ncbi:MAG: DNA glycosylase AlkZ-like family protein, partial [Thermoleophilia bacterium]